MTRAAKPGYERIELDRVDACTALMKRMQNVIAYTRSKNEHVVALTSEAVRYFETSLVPAQLPNHWVLWMLLLEPDKLVFGRQAHAALIEEIVSIKEEASVHGYDTRGISNSTQIDLSVGRPEICQRAKRDYGKTKRDMNASSRAEQENHNKRAAQHPYGRTEIEKRKGGKGENAGKATGKVEGVGA